ncbi:MAG: hypothetical protein HY518_03130 [Candidatus Aenigmarchaeota archaeon]|nr:hypothetical protein [Candidatus Aenigmarchaeota archaeon]
MDLKMGFGLRQDLRLAQRLELKLVAKLLPPAGWTFKEPPPIKGIKREGRQAYVEIGENELLSYAEGCRGIAEVIASEHPDYLLVSLRGGKPPADVVDHMTKGKYTKVYAKTSYFLKGLGAEMDMALRACQDEGRIGKVLMVDTSVTGTKLSWFLPEMLSSLSGKVGHDLDFVTAVLWHGREGWHEERTERYGCITNRQYNIGVRSLICEDNPTLLGMTYDKRRDSLLKRAEDAVEDYEIHAYDSPERASIRVMGLDGKANEYHLDDKAASTAGLFVGLVRDYANRQGAV